MISLIRDKIATCIALGRNSKKTHDTNRNVALAVYGGASYGTCNNCFKFISKRSWKKHDKTKCDETPY